MKKYALVLLVLTFVFGLFTFSAGSAEAYDLGCTSFGPYSTITGQYCGTVQIPSTVCQAGDVFSRVTGQLCNGSQYNYSYQNPYGTQYTDQYQYVNNYSNQYQNPYSIQNLYQYQNQYQYSNQYPYSTSYAYQSTYPTQYTLASNIYGGTAQYPQISSISPSLGRPGTQVTIFGSGFGYNGCNFYSCANPYPGYMSNTVNFGGYQIVASFSSDSRITFTVPTNLNNCSYGLVCTQVYIPVNPGVYPISVTNSSGTSNAVSFTVTN